MAGRPLYSSKCPRTVAFMKDPEAMDKLCEFILGGEGLVNYCIEHQLKRDTIRNWIFSDPEKVRRYNEARTMAADTYVALAEKALKEAETDQDGMLTNPGVNLANHKANHYRWMATRLDPKTFGDRTQVEVTQTISIASALAEAKGRIIEGEVVKPLLEKDEATSEDY